MTERMAHALPASLPVFPLASVLLLPGGQVPLHIFEPRYRALVEHALAGDKMIGMVHADPGLGDAGDAQPAALLPLGCAGVIESCERLPDGRFALVLEGLSRFRIAEELPLHTGGFRQVRPDWSAYGDDLRTTEESNFRMDRDALVDVAEKVLLPGTRLNRTAVKNLDNADLLRALAMHTPLSVWDMQALLDADAGTPRADALLAALECALAIQRSAHASTQRH